MTMATIQSNQWITLSQIYKHIELTPPPTACLYIWKSKSSRWTQTKTKNITLTSLGTSAASKKSAHINLVIT
jgi:hypothetical protein